MPCRSALHIDVERWPHQADCQILQVEAICRVLIPVQKHKGQSDVVQYQTSRRSLLLEEVLDAGTKLTARCGTPKTLGASPTREYAPSGSKKKMLPNSGRYVASVLADVKRYRKVCAHPQPFVVHVEPYWSLGGPSQLEGTIAAM